MVEEISELFKIIGIITIFVVIATIIVLVITPTESITLTNNGFFIDRDFSETSFNTEGELPAKIISYSTDTKEMVIDINYFCNQKEKEEEKK